MHRRSRRNESAAAKGKRISEKQSDGEEEVVENKMRRKRNNTNMKNRLTHKISRNGIIEERVSEMVTRNILLCARLCENAVPEYHHSRNGRPALAELRVHVDRNVASAERFVSFYTSSTILPSPSPLLLRLPSSSAPDSPSFLFSF